MCCFLGLAEEREEEEAPAHGDHVPEVALLHLAEERRALLRSAAQQREPAGTWAVVVRTSLPYLSGRS